MKTYAFLVGTVLMVSLAACSKSTQEPIEEIDDPAKIEADYTVLLDENGSLKAKSLEESGDGLDFGKDNLDFPAFPVSNMSYFADNSLSLFQVTEDCQGKILIYDFESGNHELVTTFLDLEVCDLKVTAVSHSDSHAFISFTKTEVGKKDSFFVRIIDLESGNKNSVDIGLNLKPLYVVPSNNKLFVLTLDEEITDENGITVIDINDQSIVFEKMIGFDAKKIFKNPAGDIIISYPELHTTLDNSTFTEAYTQYGKVTKPNLFTSDHYRFDTAGKMYYLRTEEGSGIESIPAIFDFNTNIATLYYYENFLSSTQLTSELNVHSTTAIAYDEKNNFILVGYKKNGNDNKGGILRLTPTPNFKYVDNLDLPGTPKFIFVD